VLEYVKKFKQFYLTRDLYSETMTIPTVQL